MTTYKIGDRVRVQGALGTVIRVSARLKDSILVEFATGHTQAFRPEELVKVEAAVGTVTVAPPQGGLTP